MLSNKKIKKLEKDLVTTNEQVRNLSIEDCLEVLEEAVKAVKELPPEFRNKVTFSFNPHTIAKSYRYIAYGTAISATFTKKGEVKEVKVFRSQASFYYKIRLIAGIRFKNEVVSQNNGQPVSEKIEKLILKSMGFNPIHWHKNI